MAGAKIPPPDVGAIVGVAYRAGHDHALVLIGQRREVPANDALVPAGVVPALVVAAVTAIAAARQAFFGGHDAVGRAVGHLGHAANGAFGRPHDIAAAARHVAVVVVRPLVAPWRHAERRSGNVAPAFVDLALIEAGAPGIVAAAEGRASITGGFAPRR